MTHPIVPPLPFPARALAGAAALALWAGTAPAEPAAPRLEFVAASAETLAEPHDIVLSPDGSRLYVADNANDRIVVLDPESLRELGVFAEGEVSAPHDVDFDPAGRLLVADTGNSRIAIYQVSGNGGRLVGELRGRIRRPEGVAALPDGGVLATGAGSGNLVEFRDGRVVREAGGFSAPHDVALDPAGGIWVADAANDRMVLLDAEFRTVRVLSGEPYGFSGPRYMDFDERGLMYLADKYTNQVKFIAPDGTLLGVLGTPSAGKGPGRFDRPEGVEIRGADVWFADTYNDRIVRYRRVD